MTHSTCLSLNGSSVSVFLFFFRWPWLLLLLVTQSQGGIRAQRLRAVYTILEAAMTLRTEMVESDVWRCRQCRHANIANIAWFLKENWTQSAKKTTFAPSATDDDNHIVITTTATKTLQPQRRQAFQRGRGLATSVPWALSKTNMSGRGQVASPVYQRRRATSGGESEGSEAG